MGNKKTRIVIKVLKIIGWFLFSIVALLILVAVAVQIPWVQNKIKQEAVSFLENKIGTRVGLDHFSLSFPKKIVLEGVYLEDQSKDTLLYAGRVGVDTDLWELKDNIIDLKKIELDRIVAEISRPDNDSAFNFDYIVKAFVTDSVATTDTTSASWDFKLGDIELNDIRVSFRDSLSGNHLSLRLGESEIDTERFDLETGDINFGDVLLRNVDADVVQTKLPVTIPDTVEIVPEDSAAIAFNIGFRRITLDNVNALYDQAALRQVMKLILPSALVEARTIDLKKQTIDLENIAIRDALISFQQMEVDAKDTIAKVVPQMNEQNKSQGTWKVSLGSFDLSGSSIQYYDYNQQRLDRGMDFNHLWVSDLNTRLRNLLIDGVGVRVDVNKFSFKERSGFRINSFHTSFAMGGDSLSLKNFLVNTGSSKIVMEAKASFPSMQALQENPASADFFLDVKSSTLSLKDLYFFNPAMIDSIPPALRNNSSLMMDSYISGTLADLRIERLQLHGLTNTSIFAAGTIKNVLDPNSLYANIHLDRFNTGKTDILSVVPAALIPPTIEIPKWLRLSGDFKGTMKSPQSNGILLSEFGKVSWNLVADLQRTSKENYKGEIRVSEFALGRALKQPETIGKLDMVAALNGTGTTIEDLNAVLKLRVNRIDYNGYTYRDFRVDGNIKKYFFSGNASLKDENLNFILNADLDYNNDIPHYVLELDLKNADLKKLNLVDQPMKLKTILNVDLESPDFKKINGDVSLRNFGVFNGKKLYMVDSLLFASIDQEGRNEITIASDILAGEFKGTINLMSLPEVLGRHFNRYFALHDTTFEKPLDQQNFKFNLVIKNTDLITEILVPGLEPFVPGVISGEFNSAANDLKLDLGLSQIKYNTIGFDSVSFKTLSDDESLDFTLAFKKITMDTLSISVLRLAGNIMNDSIHTNLMILDSLGKEKYFLGGVFHSFEDAFQFTFLKNHIWLNYEKWDAPLYNSLQFTDGGLEPNNFFIEKGEERILLLKKNNADSTLSLAFRKVDLKDLTSLVEGTTPIGGFIDGEVTLASAMAGTFETDLKIHELEIFDQIWGELEFAMRKKSVGPTNFNLALEGANAEMKADGFFSSGDDPALLIRGNIPRINLAILEPMTFGQLKDLKGNLRGEFSVHGRTADPQISGGVNFNNASFLSTFTKTTFFLPDETVYVRNGDIIFDRFSILDANKNRAILEGVITSSDGGGFNLGLNLHARNFQLLNTKEGDNELIYGKVGLNTKASISGTSVNPIVRMNISLTEKSELTYIVPQAEKAVADQKGVVVFIDKDARNDPFMKSINPRDTISNTFSGMDLTANIELTDTEKFNVVIDPAAGDKLEVKGNSTLTLHIDASGEMQLTGRYEISEGNYALSFAKLVKRQFAIEKGSTITWSGDPLNAEMNMRAIYAVETSPVELVVNQVTEAELPMYKKQVPFQVYLILKGQLLFPDISFELDMPETDRDEFGGSIYAKLKDINTRESDLNKQVFALLILKRFISDNPLENKAGGSFESSARQSVSKILSDQLNRLSSNVKGVQLSFDLKSGEDYSSGSASNQTELELGVSKSLMNDRLVVKVSGNVDLEGEQAQQQNSLTDFVGDLALEYKLTSDGRFRITGFRNNSYDLINGNLIETGAGLIYIKDYDSLLELFKPNEKRK